MTLVTVSVFESITVTDPSRSPFTQTSPLGEKSTPFGPPCTGIARSTLSVLVSMTTTLLSRVGKYSLSVFGGTQS